MLMFLKSLCYGFFLTLFTAEAMDFRDWCDSEWSRLTGTNGIISYHAGSLLKTHLSSDCLFHFAHPDTSFLEFCIKQPTAEAEMLLRENVGSLDRNGQFIDKFLNYKAFLSTEVIETAFRAPSNRGPAASRVNPASSAGKGGGPSAEAEQDGGGKKKGKKGKKVSAAVLGFNVVSNRIMMGEIQNVD